MKKLLCLVFALLLGCATAGPISKEKKTEFLVLKNMTTCIVVDYVIAEMEEGKQPLVVAGGLLKPEERKEFALPAGAYCVYMKGYRNGELIGQGVKCGVIPDPNLPKNAKAVLTIDAAEGVCPEKRVAETDGWETQWQVFKLCQ
ncbi:MAG: hypothetical protein ACFFCW_38500 [Candidatus Hodarchaeota archaeon]